MTSVPNRALLSGVSAPLRNKVTSPEGFREAVERMAYELPVISVEVAAVMAAEIRSGARKAAKRLITDDLEDVLAGLELLKDRVRHRSRKQRSGNLYMAALAGAIGSVISYGAKSFAWSASFVVPILVIAAVLVIVAGKAAFEASDWREDVHKPLDDAAVTLDRVLTDRPDESGGPYRRPATPAGATRPESTGVRAAPTMDTEPGAEAPDPEPPTAEAKRGRR
jgi:hypothetical protein